MFDVKYSSSLRPLTANGRNNYSNCVTNHNNDLITYSLLHKLNNLDRVCENLRPSG